MPREVTFEIRPDGLADPSRLRAVAASAADVPAADVARVEVLRRAVDARRTVRFVIRARVVLVGEEVAPDPLPSPPKWDVATKPGPPVAIVGAGPAGLFAALRLAERGLPAVVLERGKPVQARRRDIAALNKQGLVAPDSNYAFGEGGAGTYSDGKLYTRADKRGSVGDVLRTLVAHGAPLDVLVDARPHVGSNRLPRVVTRLRETLECAGVAFRFDSRATELVVAGGRVRGVRLSTGEEIAARAVVLAAGHSARDVFELAAAAGAAVEAKGFAVGVRVEHPQPLVDEAQYGRDAGHPLLSAASYRLATVVGGRGVFSFCMCPGGWIVPATTEPDAVVVNGMSLARRDSPFANSGIVVAIEPRDLAAFGEEGPFAGVRFQRELECRTAALGGGAQTAPAQRVSDFLAGRESSSLPRSSYRPGLRSAPLDEALPPFVASRIREALRRFARSIRGFDSSAGIAVAVESRSSSPVRIVRDPATLESPTLERLYPCGEGAGYAGGIVSAALDGWRVAEAVARST